MDSSYKIVSKGELIIVTFKGKLGKDNLDMLVKCTEEVLQYEANQVILYFREVTGIDTIIHRKLALLQMEVRKGRKLFLCGFSSSLKMQLLEKGIIRPNEMKGSLEEVLKDL